MYVYNGQCNWQLQLAVIADSKIEGKKKIEDRTNYTFLLI
jgi:hypothetical protein